MEPHSTATEQSSTPQSAPAPSAIIMKKEGWEDSRRVDFVFRLVTGICAFVAFVIILGIFAELLRNSRLSIAKFGFGFLVSQEWNPVTQEFGALSSIYGTLVSTVIALMIAVPMSIVIALFLVEIAPPLIGKVVGYAIELLAAIPSIIYGMWGLFVFAPFMANHIQAPLEKYLGFMPLFRGPTTGIGLLTSGIILALMILPFVSAVMRDVFRMVPPVLKEAGHGMGATTWEVTYDIMIRYGISGLVGACFLGLGRAIGETMAITFVIGSTHNISLSLFEAGHSIASTIANEYTEASEPLYLHALVELGLILFLLTFVIQIIAQFWLKGIHKRMGANVI